LLLLLILYLFTINFISMYPQPLTRIKSRLLQAFSKKPLLQRSIWICLLTFALSSLTNLYAQSFSGTKGSAQSVRVVNFSQIASQQAASPVEGNQVRKYIKRMPVPQNLPLPDNARIIKDQYGLISNSTNAPPVGTIEANSPAPASSFAALGDNNTFIPPDTHGAAGPNHLMVTLNSQVRIQNRSGGVISTVTLNGFFGKNVFDPKILYDPYAGRWIFVVCANARSANSGFMVAISATNNPTGNWFIYFIDLDASDTDWFDYPSVGFNKNWICIQGNRFAISGNSFKGSSIFALKKSDFYAGGAAHYNSWNKTDIGGTQSPAITYSTTLNEMYLLCDWNGNFSGNGYLRLFTISGSIGSETLTYGPFIATPNPWASWGVSAPQRGDSRRIDNGDSRMMNVIYRNGSLWAAHTVFLPASSPTRSSVQWWQVTTAGAIQQRGRIDDAGGTFYHAYPSISVNSSNDALVGYSRFSSGQYASANYSFRLSSDAVNTVQPTYTFKSGEAPYFKDYNSGQNRWGDYSATVVDPLNDQDFWTIQEYAESPRDLWGTWWARVSKTQTSTPAITSFSPSGGPAGVGMAIKGTNFNNVTAVRFNGVTATQIYVASSTLVYATVPAGASTGKIQVVANGATATSAASFTVGPISSVWVNKTGLAKARSQHGALAANGKIYAFGGISSTGLLNALEIYNPATNTSSTGASMPTGSRGMSFALGSNGAIYVVSGLGSASLNTQLYRYTPSTNTWATLASIPGAVWEGAAAATSNGKVYVFGGQPSGGGATNATRIYNISTNSWSTGASMPVGVLQHSAVTGADGKIYIIGGRTSSGALTGSVQVYNPSANTWATGASMLIPKVQFGAVLAANGKIYVVGGKVNSSDGVGPFFHTVEIYTPSTNSWANGPFIRAQAGELEAVSLSDNLYSIAGTDGTYRNYNFQLILPPVAPSALTATAASFSQINLKWTDKALNETNYIVERATASAGPFTVIATLGANSISYSNTGLTAGKTYYYRVKASNTAGSSAYSNVASATTPAAFASAAKSIEEAPNFVSNLSVWPNPVDRSTTMRFSLNQDQKVQLLVYNMEGKVIDKVYEGDAKAGKKYQFNWNPRSHASGTYITTLRTEKGVFHQKIILIPR
jgi:N-acetylneuraminic acid mutarotase